MSAKPLMNDVLLGSICYNIDDPQWDYIPYLENIRLKHVICLYKSEPNRRFISILGYNLRTMWRTKTRGEYYTDDDQLHQRSCVKIIVVSCWYSNFTFKKLNFWNFYPYTIKKEYMNHWIMSENDVFNMFIFIEMPFLLFI